MNTVLEGAARMVRASLVVVVASAASTMSQPAASTEPAVVPMAAINPYPRGRWRLANPESLGTTVVWLSHILVRSAESEVGETLLGAPDWRPLVHAPERSRGVALDLATKLQREASRDPTAFAKLARVHSEDDTTRDAGGSLGGVLASQFLPEPRLLDVVQALRPGEVSAVVGSRFGFHVFQRHNPPALVTLAGKRIVVGYDGAPWLDARKDRPTPRRTRGEAFAIAHELSSSATVENFALLVDQYSDHRDVAEGGDIGVWTSWDPTHLPRELEVLSRTDLGQVTSPIDSASGVEVLLRADDRAPADYRMESVEVRFSNDGLRLSEERAQAIAEEVALETRDWAPILYRYQAIHCCRGVRRWRRGERDPRLERVIDDMEVGAVSAPLRVDDAFVLIKKLDISGALTRPNLRNLPSPDSPDFDYVLDHTSGALLARYTRGFGEKGSSLLRLPQGTRDEFLAIHTDLARALAEGGDEAPARRRKFAVALSKLRGLLGEERFARYWRWVNDVVTTAVIQNQF